MMRSVILGLGFGLYFGILPLPGGLLLLLLGFLLFAFSSAGYWSAILSGVVVHFAVLPFVVVSADKLGESILLAPAGQNMVAALFAIPFVPWTMLDNTLVLGTFLVGLAALILTQVIVLIIPAKKKIRLARQPESKIQTAEDRQ
ncbi:hypothetical protein FACS189443_3390 [Planctomycetales bacterium]|nr:hypothetical protein FACS189443_3390 [Planctomycetales bacterium]